MKFKIGDKVITKSHEQILQIGDSTRCGFLEEMKEQCGRIGTITCFDDEHNSYKNVHVKIDGFEYNFYWSQVWLIPSILDKLDKILGD